MILLPQYCSLQISEIKIFLYSFGDKTWPDLYWFIGKIQKWTDEKLFVLLFFSH